MKFLQLIGNSECVNMRSSERDASVFSLRNEWRCVIISIRCVHKNAFPHWNSQEEINTTKHKIRTSRRYREAVNTHNHTSTFTHTHTLIYSVFNTYSNALDVCAPATAVCIIYRVSHYKLENMTENTTISNGELNWEGKQPDNSYVAFARILAADCMQN